MDYGAGGDGLNREKSPSEDTSSSINLASVAASGLAAAAKYFFRGGEGAPTGQPGDKPREVRTGSDADWDMVDTPGDLALPKSRDELDKCMMEMTKEISKKDEEIKKLGMELKRMEQLAEERRIQLQQRPRSGSMESGAGSDVQHLQDRIREQAQLVLKLKREREDQSQYVMSLRGKIRELEETLEITATDKTSYEGMVQEAEDERDKVKDDFENAKEEIKALKVEIKQLNHELSLTKREAMRVTAKGHVEEESATGDCVNSKCKEVRTNFHDLERNFDKKLNRIAYLERLVDSQKKQIHELEGAKNEAAGVIAAAKMEAEIHKADFLEERRDRERAQGKVAALEQKAGGQSSHFHEERAQLYKELNDCKKELSKLKVQKAQSEAKLQTRVKTLNEVVDNLTKQIETVSTERDDARYEVQRRKASKNQKIKEYDRMKQQLHDSTKGNVKLVEQLEDIRREKKELLKMVKKEQDKQRKADKKSKTSGHESLSMTESTGTPQTAAEELAALRSQISGWRADIKHYQEMIKTLSIGIRDGTALFSPTENEKSLVSPTTEQQINTETSYQGDCDYVPSESDPDPQVGSQPEMDIRGQLAKYQKQKQLGPMQVPFEVGIGGYKHRGGNTEPQGLHSNEMERGIEDAAGARRSATSEHQYYNEHQSRGAKQGNSRPRSLGANRDNQGGSSSCRSPVGNNQLPPSGSAATANKPPRAGVQGQPVPTSDHCRQSQSSQDSSHPDLLRANPSPLLTRQSSHEPPPLRAGGASSEPPLRAGGPSSEPPLRAGGPSSEPPLRAGGPSSVQPAPIQSHVTITSEPPHSEVVRHSNLPHADNSTGNFQKPAPYSAPQNVGGQQYMFEGAQAAQMQPPRAGGQQFQSEHAQTYPMTDPSVANVPPQQDDVSYQNVSAGARARDYGGSSAPVGHQGGQPPPSHMPSAQSQQQYNTESERPAAYYGEPGGGRPHGAQAPRKPSSEPNPERISYPNFPEQKSNTETVETGTQMSISFTHPLIEKQPTGHGAKAKAAKRRGEEEEQENVLVEKIDNDIRDVAADVREEVSEENERIMTMEHKPYDPNLVCPMCGKKHRIGEIQKFRKHVSGCDGNIV